MRLRHVYPFTGNSSVHRLLGVGSGKWRAYKMEDLVLTAQHNREKYTKTWKSMEHLYFLRWGDDSTRVIVSLGPGTIISHLDHILSVSSLPSSFSRFPLLLLSCYLPVFCFVWKRFGWEPVHYWNLQTSCSFWVYGTHFNSIRSHVGDNQMFWGSGPGWTSRFQGAKGLWRDLDLWDLESQSHIPRDKGRA